MRWRFSSCGNLVSHAERWTSNRVTAERHAENEEFQPGRPYLNRTLLEDQHLAAPFWNTGVTVQGAMLHVRVKSRSAKLGRVPCGAGKRPETGATRAAKCRGLKGRRSPRFSVCAWKTESSIVARKETDLVIFHS